MIEAMQESFAGLKFVNGVAWLIDGKQAISIDACHVMLDDTSGTMRLDQAEIDAVRMLRLP